MAPIKVYFVTSGTGVNVLLDGKSSPILRRVEGNAWPASAAWWPSREAALVDLPAIFGGWPVEVVER